ncbi:MAG: tetratricopeptide repeat protein [Chloroflexi bacterium AL-W]|nr:tetratricopeptide repeat protein [Chloroflexi bacterium AL-N1]NOK65357.1 tetratricopeptide repeat protein [Chloroflexi bacterium AL-N10]NOK72377.1 tetratricopeptide repeat protein [Chloroflexi bacterium AL-N5]NOK79536.1 tetratricopeptide repeat protein [Chloroflexi bacterium AL-W]NOK87452.1 tetratricopeptide repeat protein [Chloroflexi bacterium AL-N15]
MEFHQKITIPRILRPLVHRDVALDAFAQNFHQQTFVVLSAPTGWGKTALLVQWAETRAPCRVAWYTLDASDRDPALFLSYLVATLHFVPKISELRDDTENPDPKNFPATFHRLATTLANVETDIAIVLDDLHVLDATEEPLPGVSQITNFLSTLITYAPRCHLILSSRTIPTLPGMVRLMSQGHGSIYDYRLLRCSTEEVRRLAEPDLSLDQTQAQQIAEEYDGWITGILFGLEQQRSGVNSPYPILSVDDFLAELVDPLPSHLQEFLEETSVLDELIVGHCDRVRDCQDSATLLDAVSRRGLFILSHGTSMAYHQLFRDMLSRRLQRTPERYRCCCQRAASVYEEQGMVGRALRCLLDTQDIDAAWTLLRNHLPQLRQRSLHTTALSCLDDAAHVQQIPPDLLVLQARLYADLAMWDRAIAATRVAETTAITLPDVRYEARVFRVECLLFCGSIDQAKHELDELLAHPVPSTMTVLVAIAQGRLCSMTGQIDAAIKAFNQARVYAENNQADMVTLGTIYDNLGFVHAVARNYTLAVQYLQSADQCWHTCQNHGRRAMTLNNLGTIAMGEQHLVDAQVSLTTGLAIAQQTQRRREEAYLQYSLAELQFITAATERALAQFETAYTTAHQYAIRVIQEQSVTGAWLAALLLQSSTAVEWQERTQLYLPMQTEVGKGRVNLIQCVEQIQARKQIDDLTTIRPYLPHLSPVERVLVALFESFEAWQADRWIPTHSGWMLCTQWMSSFSTDMQRHLARLVSSFLRAIEEQSSLAQKLVQFLDPLPQEKQLTISSSKFNQEPSIAITALGKFSCAVHNQLRELTGIQKTILARILDHRAPLALEQLWADIWGEREMITGTVYKAIQRMRVETGLTLEINKGHIIAHRELDTIHYDVWEFEIFCRSQQWEQAIEVYQGDFLVTGGTESLWIYSRREHLRHLFHQALQGAADRLLQTDPPHAIDYYQRWLANDPCNEDAVVMIMKLAAKLGKRPILETTYRKFEQALKQDGIPLGTEVQALYEQLSV